MHFHAYHSKIWLFRSLHLIIWLKVLAEVACSLRNRLWNVTSLLLKGDPELTFGIKCQRKWLIFQSKDTDNFWQQGADSGWSYVILGTYLEIASQPNKQINKADVVMKSTSGTWFQFYKAWDGLKNKPMPLWKAYMCPGEEKKTEKECLCVIPAETRIIRQS